MGPAGDHTKDRRCAIKAISIFLNHNLRRFDNSGYDITLLQFKFVSTAARNGAFDKVVSNANHNVSHDIAELNLFYCSAQFVAS